MAALLCIFILCIILHILRFSEITFHTIHKFTILLHFYRQGNVYNHGHNSTNPELNNMSTSAITSSSGVGGPNSPSPRVASPGFFKGPEISPVEVGGHQPPDPPHRSFASDGAGLPSAPSGFPSQIQHAEKNNR